MARRMTTTLGALSDEDLAFWPAWQVVDVTDDGDQVLVPARINERGEIESTVDQVWCRSVCHLANGMELPACTLCVAQTGEGPIAWSITYGTEELRLILPPAPDFVLDEEGPEALARKLNLELSETFPLVLVVSATFEMRPQHRSARITAEGAVESLSG